MSLAVVVIARDEEARLDECLASVSWADERIVVVDDRTLDATAEVARRHTRDVHVRPFGGYSEQRAWAETQATSEWIMWMDADERATPELASAVAEALRATDRVAFRVPRLDRMFGRWIRHGGWYPQYHVRLYRRGAVRWEGRVHERAIAAGPVGTLGAPVHHLGHVSVTEWVEKMARYTTLEAEEMRARGERVGALRILLEPAAYGFYKYVIQKGFLDGGHGLVLGCLLACYRLVRNVKAWDLQRAAAPPQEEEPRA